MVEYKIYYRESLTFDSKSHLVESYDSYDEALAMMLFYQKSFEDREYFILNSDQQRIQVE